MMSEHVETVKNPQETPNYCEEKQNNCEEMLNNHGHEEEHSDQNETLNSGTTMKRNKKKQNNHDERPRRDADLQEAQNKTTGKRNKMDTE